MSIEIRMPRLVDTMTQGSVVAWRKREGEPVQAGEVIAEIEVDKATVDLESPGMGRWPGSSWRPGRRMSRSVRCWRSWLQRVRQWLSRKLEQPPVPSLPPDRDNGHAVRSPAAIPLAARGSRAADRDRHQSPGGRAWHDRQGSMSPPFEAAVREAASRGLM